MHKLDFSLLDLDSTIHDLPGYQVSAHPTDEGQVLLDAFNKLPDLPGILILSENIMKGIISRRIFFEHTGKRFGTEVYLKRPISFLLDKGIPKPLVFQSNTKLSLAAQTVLCRHEADVYEPIVETAVGSEHRIINILTLFAAQNQILVSLHNQRINGMKAFLPLDDNSAIRKFLKHAGIPTNVDTANFKRIYSIHCPNCGQMVKYSIADIVRSFPTLQQGIEISNRMGTRMYLFNVRHTCGDQIIDLPVQHDHNLEYRSIKPPRLVETYA